MMNKQMSGPQWLARILAAAALAVALGACAMEGDGELVEDPIAEDEMLIPSDGSATTNSAGVTDVRVIANHFGKCTAAQVGMTCKLATAIYANYDNSRHCQPNLYCN